MKSSVLSGTSDQLVMIQNAIDDVRRNVTMSIVKANNGGSHIQTSDEQPSKTMETRTVLLSDVILEAVKVERPKHIVIKMDIESYECKAFLGSPDGKLNQR